MKSYRKTNFRIQQRNQHLINILEEDYYIELGTIDIPVMDKLLNGSVIDLNELIYEDIAIEGTGKVFDNCDQDLKYQLLFLESLRYKNTSNKIFLTCGVLHFKLPQENNYSYAPIVLIPVDIDYENNKVTIASSPIINTILTNKIQASLGISADTLPHNPEVYQITNYCLNYAEKTNFEFSMGNYLTVSSIEYNEHAPSYDDLSTQRSIYEKSVKEVHDLFYQNIKAVLPTNVYQKWALVKIDNGESFVVDGALGSGKTYTIVNALADSILKNKKVLYVSQDFDNIKDMYKELNNIQASSYTYNLSKNTIYEKLEPEDIPSIRDEKVSAETLSQILEYEQALESSIHGCRYFKVITKLAEIKNTIPDIVKIPIDVSLQNHEIQKVYNELKEIEEILETIEPLDINVWSKVEQYYAKNHIKEISEATQRYANIIKTSNRALKAYCNKYSINLPSNYLNAQRLLSYISPFTKITPPKCWVKRYDSDKIKEILNVISNYQNTDKIIKQVLTEKLVVDYQTGEVEELLNVLCYKHLTTNNFEELNNILKKNDLINEILLTVKTEQKNIQDIINKLRFNLDLDKFEKNEIEYFTKLYDLLKYTNISSLWTTFYVKNRNQIDEIFKTFENLLQKFNQIKEILKPYLIKEDSLSYDNIKLTLKDRNYIKSIQDLFDKKSTRKNKISSSTLNHQFLELFDLGQKIETEAKKFGLLDNLSLDKFICYFSNWIDFINNLTDRERIIFRHQITHDDKTITQNDFIVSLFEKFDRSRKILLKNYSLLSQFGINIKGDTIVEKTYDSLDWLIYLRKVVQANDRLRVLFKNTTPTLDDMIIIINTDKEYVNLLENLDKDANEMKKYLGETYKGLDTDCMLISVLENNYGLFLKQLKDETVIGKLFENNLINDLINEFGPLHSLIEKRLSEHNLFSRYFVGGQYDLLTCSLNESQIIINKYEERIVEIRPVFQVFEYLHRFEKLGLKQLCEIILSAQYSKGIGEIFIYSIYSDYQNELINKNPILLESNNILTWIENFNFFERNHCQINIRSLQRNKVTLEKRLVNHITNLKFNDYNKIVDALLPYKNVFLADVDIFNSDLDLSKFDIVFIDDVHLSSAFKYNRIVQTKQVVMFGTSTNKSINNNNLFKNIPNKYILRFVQSYVKDNPRLGNNHNIKNQYILDFSRTESFKKFKTLKDLVSTIVGNYYTDMTKTFDIIFNSVSYKFAFYKRLVEKLKEVNSDEEIFQILNNNIRMVRVPYEKSKVVDEVYYLFDDLKDLDILQLKYIIPNYASGCSKVNVYTTNEYSNDFNATQLFKSIIEHEIEGTQMPPLTKIICDELKERGISAEAGIGRIDLMIKGGKSKTNESIPNIGIIIEGLNTKTPYSILDDYEYYYNEYTKKGWQIYIFYVGDIIDNLQEKLDIISQFLANKDSQSMHQLKIDEFIK
ncbi:MAG: hypothetical protein IJE45_00170 [Bacilli bacterium]|nr:hypothetical protein [Bacilli bacterium]